MSKTKISKFAEQVLLGANIATIIAMIITGFSYLVDPMVFPAISLLGLIFPFIVVVNILFMLFWTFFHWTKIIYSFGGLVICFVPVTTYFGLNRPMAHPEDCMKVMSFNACNFSIQEGCDQTKDDIVQYLVDSECDIICMQESMKECLTETMQKELSAVYPYQHWERKRSNTLTILSKYEITEIDSIHYESIGNFTMYYRLNTPKGNLLVINNHLETNRFSHEEKEEFGRMMHGNMNKNEMKDETKGVMSKLIQAVEKRNIQAKAVADFIDLHEDEQMIVCGDFNEWPVSYTHHVIAQNLTDCFIATAFGPGWSYARNGMRIRIDNILCSKDLTPYECHIDKSIKTSDHYPIVSYISHEKE